MLGQLQEDRVGDREFQIVGDTTEELQMWMEWWVDWYWMTLMNKQECEITGGNVNMEAVSNVKYWKSC